MELTLFEQWSFFYCSGSWRLMKQFYSCIAADQVPLKLEIKIDVLIWMLIDVKQDNAIQILPCLLNFPLLLKWIVFHLCWWLAEACYIYFLIHLLFNVEWLSFACGVLVRSCLSLIQCLFGCSPCVPFTNIFYSGFKLLLSLTFYLMFYYVLFKI
jgi:hypothetical protein